MRNAGAGSWACSGCGVLLVMLLVLTLAITCILQSMYVASGLREKTFRNSREDYLEKKLGDLVI